MPTPPKPPTLHSPQAAVATQQSATATEEPDRATDTKAPLERPQRPASYLTGEQVRVLLTSIAAHRVATMTGPGGGRISHVEAWDIRAHLNRIFGFARWSADVVDLHLIYEQEKPSQNTNTPNAVRWTCSYRATVRLTVNAPDGTVLATYTEAAAGSPMGPMPDRSDAHDMAIKTAESQAFKRCAANLGTQFGLSLYDDGRLDDVVQRTLVGAPTT